MSSAQAKAITHFQDHQPILEEFYITSGQAPSPIKILIRKYQESDREALRWICCETGFLGRPIDPIYRDRELFADLITNPYLDYEPEWTLVAECNGQVVGYLVGSVNPHFSRSLMLRGFQTACKMLTRLLTSRYTDHPRSEQFVRWVWTKGFMEMPKHPDEAAHLHMNFLPSFRVGAVTLRIWKVFKQMLTTAGIDHCYGEFFSCDRRNPERVYARYGFEFYDRSETTIFQPEISTPVSIVCAHKLLTNQVVSMPPKPMKRVRRSLHA